MCWTDDPVRDAERHYNRLEERLRKRPKCVHCREHIQEEEYFNMDGDAVCENCLVEYCKENYKERIEDERYV